MGNCSSAPKVDAQGRKIPHPKGSQSNFAKRMGNNVVNGISTGFGWRLGGDAAQSLVNEL